VRVESWIQEAVESGARLLCGGKRVNSTIEPAVLVDVPASARISCEEVFGPVVAVYRYSSLEDAIARTNDTPFGLQAGIFTTNLPRAFSAAKKLHFGGVLINDVPCSAWTTCPTAALSTAASAAKALATLSRR